MNPALRRLGYGPEDRVVIIHADDIGMCHATIPAITDLFDFGLVSSAATMVPCPWFMQAAAYCQEHPGVDMGVHLTLNSEWTNYRWGPVSTRDTASGLLDDQGYFHQWPPATEAQATPQAVDVELRAQIDRALAAGIEPTHVDSHMGTVLHPRFLAIYHQIAIDYRLPLLCVGRDAAALKAFGADDAMVTLWMNQASEREARGLPVFDAIDVMPLDQPEDRLAVVKQKIDQLKPGLNMLIFHPSVDTPELRAIAPDWRARVADHQVFLEPALRDYIHESGVTVIGYQPLRDLVRAQA